LIVQDVRSGALAANIGLRPRDQIVAIQDYRVSNPNQFVQYLFDPDWRYDRVPVWVVRNGREVPIYVRPAQLIERLIVVQSDYNPLITFGVVLDNRYDRDLVVRRVIRNSPADRAGVQPGDVIVRFYGQRLSSPQQFVQAINRVDVRQAPIIVERDNSLRELMVSMPGELRTTSQQRTTYRQQLDSDRSDSRNTTQWQGQSAPQVRYGGEVYQDSFGTSGAIITTPGQPIYPGQYQPAQPVQPSNRIDDRSDRPGILPRLFGR
jgi:predicted metalloprotease with PDZ domain